MGFTSKAIEMFDEVRSRLEKIIQNKEDLSDTLRSLRTRARNTPSMIMTSGLTQTLAFLASKSDSKLYSALYKQAKTNSEIKGEEAGYAAYLYVIMRFLRESEMLTEEPANMEKVVEAIKQLDENPQQASITQSLLMEFLLEFKKVTEALIEEE